MKRNPGFEFDYARPADLSLEEKKLLDEIIEIDNTKKPHQEKINKIEKEVIAALTKNNFSRNTYETYKQSKRFDEQINTNLSEVEKKSTRLTKIIDYIKAKLFTASIW